MTFCVPNKSYFFFKAKECSCTQQSFVHWHMGSFFSVVNLECQVKCGNREFALWVCVHVHYDGYDGVMW